MGAEEEETPGNRRRVVIVTGGSRGIGAATAVLAALHCYAVCVNYRAHSSEAEDVVRAIQRDGGRALAVQADISSEPDVVRLFETSRREFGPLSALVNNAATIERQMRLDSMDAARLQRMFATNVAGTFLCSREAVRQMSSTAVPEEPSSMSRPPRRGSAGPANMSTMPPVKARWTLSPSDWQRKLPRKEFASTPSGLGSFIQIFTHALENPSA